MKNQSSLPLTNVVGKIPYRLALAGGWIDQPFISSRNPSPPGSMVVVSLEPTFRFMNRCGICSSTRDIARRLWNDELPDKNPDELVHELYMEENQDKAEPSGSQDMIGLIYPGINRLDYDFQVHGGIFPAHIESLNEPDTARWLEKHLFILAVSPRPEGYNPLGIKQLDPDWVQRLGQSGWRCFEAIRTKNLQELGASFNECMACWASLLPHTVKHPTLTVDIQSLLKVYQSQYPGAMFSGCGGGYLFVASEKPVPGGFQVTIRITG
jgi:hypothetical protein